MSRGQRRHTTFEARPGTMVIHSDASLPYVRVTAYTEANLKE